MGDYTESAKIYQLWFILDIFKLKVNLCYSVVLLSLILLLKVKNKYKE